VRSGAVPHDLIVTEISYRKPEILAAMRERTSWFSRRVVFQV